MASATGATGATVASDLWAIFAIMIGVCLILVVYFFRKLEGTFALRRGTPPTLTYRRCADCDGCGVQWLSQDGWEIIPDNLRDVNKGTRLFQPKLANTRTCPYCQGIGKIWGKPLPPPVVIVEKPDWFNPDDTNPIPPLGGP